MPRLFLLLAAGLLAGVLAFATAFWMKTREPRALLREPYSELAWLGQEFGLTPAQLSQIEALHLAYQPTCADLCRRIDAANRRLQTAILSTNTVTDEIRGLLAETGRVRDDCRLAMLGHLYAVTRELPPTAAARYLEFMLAATCLVEDPHPLAVPLSDHAHGHAH